MTGRKIKRPSKKLIKAFYSISSATAASELSLLGIRKLQEGKDLRKYYPPNEEAWKEYVSWCKEQGRPHPGKRPVLSPPPRTVLKQ